MCERTQEFQNLVSKVSDISSSTKSNASSEPPSARSKTAFNEAAGEIARGIHTTSALIAKLTNLVRRQGLFDDPTDEINKLILRIKQDLEDMNAKCDAAQLYIDSQKSMFSYSEVNQSSAHNVKVVSHLKGDLMNTTKDFKSILEMRSVKMKDQQVRKVELIGKSMLSPLRSIEHAAAYTSMGGAAKSSSSSSSSKVTANGAGSRSEGSRGHSGGIRSPYAQLNPYSSQLQQQVSVDQRYASSDADGDSSRPDHQTEQQMLLLDPISDSHYFESREKAVTEVERTIGELGQLFNRLATMISAQQELVERVDEDVESAIDNATNAQNVLMKAYEKVSSNRAMYMKIFAILGVFALFFVLFLM
jgi:syntaxin 5